MKYTIKNISILVAFMASAVAMSQPEEQTFVDIIGIQPSVEINLGKAMLGLLSSATQNEEQGIANVLSSLSSIKVTVFELEKTNKIQSIRDEINKLVRAKVVSGFEKLASIKEEDSLVYVMAHMDETKLNNLSIFALDDNDELVLIDITGNINISDIGDLIEHFNVDLDINGLELNKPKQKQQ